MISFVNISLKSPISQRIICLLDWQSLFSSLNNNIFINLYSLLKNEQKKQILQPYYSKSLIFFCLLIYLFWIFFRFSFKFVGWWYDFLYLTIPLQCQNDTGDELQKVHHHQFFDGMEHQEGLEIGNILDLSTHPKYYCWSNHHQKCLSSFLKLII